ncbi:MAG: flippase-like domain-containing protein [Methanobacteriaceae archaeon]|nr:flippase-like domain-containing protein [Methanobacteriaceae archaeon]
MAKSKIWLTLLLAVAVYLIMCIYADIDKLIQAFESFQWLYLILLLVLTTLGYFIRYIKWNYFLQSVGVHLESRDNLFVFFSGLSMIITPAKMGEIWKGWLIKEINGEKLAKTIPVVIVDRVTDLLALIILSLTGIFYYEKGSYLLLIIFLVFLAFFLVVKSNFISEKLIFFMEKRAGKYSSDVKNMHQTFEETMAPKTLLVTTILAVAAWFCECLGLFMVVLGFSQYLTLTVSTFVFSFSSLVGAVSMIPGGLGVAEATISGLLQFFGLTSTVSVGVALIIRLGTLWYGVILGLVVYLVFKRKIIKS